jgi:phosphatidylinositol glycan class B
MVGVACWPAFPVLAPDARNRIADDEVPGSSNVTITSTTAEWGRKERLVILGFLCAVGLALRVALALGSPNLPYPDEAFMLDQAHRIVWGYGITPFDWRIGMRSWYFPGLIAPAFWLGGHVLPMRNPCLLTATLLLGLISLAPVICGFLWAERLGGKVAAILTGGVAAVWLDLVYFGPRGLHEVLAGHLLIFGLYLAFPSVPVLSRGRMIAAGGLWGFACIDRIQLAPVFAVLGVYCLFKHRSLRWGGLLAGFAAAVCAYGAIDWLTLGHPWQSVFTYYDVNVNQGYANSFGAAPWHYFIGKMASFWGAALLPMVGLAWMGARRMPLLGILAASVLFSHSLVSHKEYRFVYPALVLLVLLAGIGISETLNRLQVRAPGALGCVLCFAITSAVLAVQPAFRSLLAKNQGEILSFGAIGADAGACGVILWQDYWWQTPGYTGLHRDIPIYQAGSDVRLRRYGPGANFIVAASHLDSPGEFALARTFTRGVPVYLYRRPGGCTREYLAERVLNPIRDAGFNPNP